MLQKAQASRIATDSAEKLFSIQDFFADPLNLVVDE